VILLEREKRFNAPLVGLNERLYIEERGHLIGEEKSKKQG